MKILFEKLSKEKVKIFDLQQQQQVYQVPNVNQTTEIINYETINLSDLQRNHEKVLNENKQIEVRVSFLHHIFSTIKLLFC